MAVFLCVSSGCGDDDRSTPRSDSGTDGRADGTTTQATPGIVEITAAFENLQVVAYFDNPDAADQPNFRTLRDLACAPILREGGPCVAVDCQAGTPPASADVGAIEVSRGGTVLVSASNPGTGLYDATAGVTISTGETLEISVDGRTVSVEMPEPLGVGVQLGDAIGWAAPNGPVDRILATLIADDDQAICDLAGDVTSLTLDRTVLEDLAGRNPILSGYSVNVAESDGLTVRIHNFSFSSAADIPF
ncbi:MAG: hypothetical protein AAGF12_39210 [Myxococcota bacterium]